MPSVFKKEIRNKRFYKIKKSVLLQQTCEQFSDLQLNKILPIIKLPTHKLKPLF